MGCWDGFEPPDSGIEQSVSWIDLAVADKGKMNYSCHYNYNGI